MGQIIDGYKSIYEAGIIHRDIKGSNILVSLDENFFKVIKMKYNNLDIRFWFRKIHS